MKGFLFITLIHLILRIWAIPRQFDNGKNEERIVGGNTTTVERFPYIVQLYHANRRWGGASILSPCWVITAGHCTYGEDISNITLRAGASESNQTARTPITLAEIFLHPLYNDTTLDYDISILRLNEDLVFGTTISPVSLPPPDIVLPAGTWATVAGWGDLADGGPGSTQLQAVTVPIISNEECIRLYAINDTGVIITDRLLCALYAPGGRDACNGDSGGPLTVNGVLYGLVSDGLGCADPRYPGTYTSVSNLRSFIEEVTGL
ncbi:trypsin-7-like [Agrilus planipennis]|uniref:Trypsin-7-like n=1 Tax=Agrilus planipennis TaxID=224129 RepID=A0A1W4WKW3_AGRPL|nr:trypsin-7-like [Agrilus planipennis]